MENQKFNLSSNNRNSIVLNNAPVYYLSQNNKMTIFSMKNSRTAYTNKESFQNWQGNSDHNLNKLSKTIKTNILITFEVK